MDLSLVPLTDLIEEIERRSDCFVMAFREIEVDGRSGAYHRYGKGEFYDVVGLATVLHNQVLNKWDQFDDGCTD